MFPLPAGGGRWETSFISSLRSQGFLLFSDPAPSRTTWRRNPLSQYCYFLCSSVCALPVKLYRFGRHRIDKVGAFQEYGASWFPLTRYEYLALAFQGLLADCVIGYDWVLKGLLGRCWKKGKVIENENDRYARMGKRLFSSFGKQRSTLLHFTCALDAHRPCSPCMRGSTRGNWKGNSQIVNQFIRQNWNSVASFFFSFC